MRRSWILVVAFCVGCHGLHTTIPSVEPETRDLCADLGWAVYIVSEYRARGDSREDQVVWANRSIPSEEVRYHTLRIIHYAYVAEDAPLALGLEALAHCRRDGRGRAVVDFRQPPDPRAFR